MSRLRPVTTAESASQAAVIYLRVSTRDQAQRGGEAEGFSIPAQREACLRKAELLGATVAEEFVDAGESARSANRPDLQRLLRYVRDNRVGYVIVHKVDRLARNRMDDVEIHAALTAAGATLVSCTENIDETPSGMLLHGIMSSIAEFYSRNLATESRKGMRQKAINGGTPGMVPFGYLNTRVRNEEGREIRSVVTDQERAPWVRWLYERYATGEWTTQTLRDELDHQGVRSVPRPKKPAGPLAVSQVDSILKNRYYVGVVTFEGAEYPGRHEALISEDLYQRVQAVRQSRHEGREKPQVRTHYLKGSIYCGQCGEPLSLEYSRNRLGTLYRYFYCLGRQHQKNGCTFRAAQVDMVEQLVEDHWATITLPGEHCQEIRRIVSEHMQAVLPEQARVRERAERRLAALKAESDKLLQAHYADAITLDVLKTEQQRIALAKAGAERQLADAQASEQHLERQLDRVLSLLGHAQQHYLASNSQARRYLNQGVFERIYLDDDEVVGSDLAPIFQRVMSDSLKPDLQEERRHDQKRNGRTSDLYLVPNPTPEPELATDMERPLPARSRRELPARVGDYLRFERPKGSLAWERKNLRPRKGTGSNISFLVAGTGFEPVTSGL